MDKKERRLLDIDVLADMGVELAIDTVQPVCPVPCRHQKRMPLNDYGDFVADCRRITLKVTKGVTGRREGNQLTLTRLLWTPRGKRTKTVRGN